MSIENEALLRAVETYLAHERHAAEQTRRGPGRGYSAVELIDTEDGSEEWGVYLRGRFIAYAPSFAAGLARLGEAVRLAQHPGVK